MTKELVACVVCGHSGSELNMWCDWRQEAVHCKCCKQQAREKGTVPVCEDSIGRVKGILDFK